jgi:lysozyme
LIDQENCAQSAIHELTTSRSLALTGGAFSFPEPAMQPSQNAIDLVKASEGLRLQTYRDSVGVPTIGYGHTRGVRPGMSITTAQAEQFLVDDLDEAADAVRKLVTVPLTQGQFDALCDFVFNLGAGRLAGSTLLRMLNLGDYGAAGAQLRFWIMAGGVALPGLIKRRAAELALWNKIA